MGLKCRCERTVITRAVSVVWKDLLVLKVGLRCVDRCMSSVLTIAACRMRRSNQNCRLKC